METEVNVQVLARESKADKIAPGGRLNDESKEEISDDETPYTIKICTGFNPSGDNGDSTKCSTNDSSENVNNVTFKKPIVLIGPRRPRLTAKTPNKTVSTNACISEDMTSSSDKITKSQEHPLDPPFPYIEPPWSGKPEENYKLEVLKSGTIIETMSLREQSFYVIGRLPLCHMSLGHPTISRYHAVLQYRSEKDNKNSKGFYIYDLGSTHGTFWNGNRIKPNVYVRVQGGHMLRFGCSHRKYILEAPSDDREEESKYTVSELKDMRALELEKRRANEEEGEASLEKKESDGIDWGMGDDADEETDMQENPYACITDDDLVLEDPKKTLRGWFEREGYELQYRTEEKGLGQFLCWVDLPMDDIVGRSVRADALVKGKKKEAVVQCAMEACKILDKYGLLRQANHEARKRKRRNWEAEDYYDSDEDNFLDRTGLVERKREQRMRLAGKLEEKVETYDSLLEKHKQVTKRIAHLSSSINNWQNNESNGNKESVEEDALDAFMSSLSSFAITKSDVAKMKLELLNLRKEEASLIKLLNLTRPANLPPLLSYDTTTDQAIRKIKTQTKSNQVQSTVSKISKIQDSVSRFRREKQATCQTVGAKVSSISNMLIDGEKEAKSEQVEESDDEDYEEDEEKGSAELLHSATVTTATTPTVSTVVIDTCTASSVTKCLEENKEQQEQEVKTRKKRRQERRKIVCDQDIYTSNYSTWVPPQDQVGDGKTNLNEKYGY